MENIEGFISSEMRFPSEASKKKKRYVTFKCPKCNKIEEKVYVKSQFVNLCTHCAKGGFTTYDFIQKGLKHFGNTYDYSKTVYVNTRKPVIITCPIHGDFTQRAAEHLDGHGCNQCKFDRKKLDQLLPKETWLSRISKYPLISFKNTAQIKNSNGTVDLICKIHGEFSVTLGKVGITKHLCKECARINHQIQSVRPEHIGKIATLYYAYLPDIDMYKFGVTLNLKQRLASLGNVELIAEGDKEYVEAIRLEHKVFQKLDHLRYKGKTALIKNGSTELFKQNVLKQIKRALQE